jgi:asparagine synthase (glutamine-hydrolysing)
MCGIAGLVGFSEPGQYTALLQEQLRHRGPDGNGSFTSNSVLLVHTRLSIIDVSEAGNQPLYNEDKSLVLVCNGEIYNFQALRKQLEAEGHQFASHSDSEVILHLYESLDGELNQLLHKLRGMFAFALYDLKRERLIIARDRFGIKPLYAFRQKNQLAFASEIKALAALPFVSKDIDATSVYEYLQYLSVPEPHTFFTQIKCVPAGGAIIADRQGVSEEQWYDSTTRLGSIPEEDGDYETALRSKLHETIGLHMVADVPVGSFLSAGIDSTLVTQEAASFTDIPFTTVSAAFPGTKEDESAEAGDSAKQLQLTHHAIDLNESLLADPGDVNQFFDQPFAVPSAYSLFHISAKARQYMKVVLTGDGGDEAFAGYDHKHIPFFKPALVKILPAFSHQFVSGILNLFPFQSAKDMAIALRLTDGDRFLNRTRVLSEAKAMSLIQPSMRSKVEKHRLKRLVDDVFDQTKHLHPVRQMLLADFATFLKSEMLYKVDRMTMANGIEARVPLLDHELVELAFSIPVPALRNGETGKLPLRKIVAKRLPAIAGRKKTGFLTPFSVATGPNNQSQRSSSLPFPQLLSFEKYNPKTDEDHFFCQLLEMGLNSSQKFLTTLK